MKRITALFLFMALLLSAAPGSAGEDGVVATVDGAPILESELRLRTATSSLMNAQGQLSQQERDQKEREARRSALDQLIQERALLNEAERRGISLTGAVQADAQERYHRMIASVESYVLSYYPNLTGVELNAQVDALLKTAGASRDQYRASAQQAALISALEKALCQEMSPPDPQELQQAYQELYARQKVLFDGSENDFEAALLKGELVVYRPRSLKLIQKAEFTFPPEAMALIRQTRAVSPADAEAMEKDQYLLLADRVEAVYGALMEGSRAFGDVLEELEPGSSGKVNYFHPFSTRFGESYYSRANAFVTPGEISTTYVIPNGYAVLYYAGDLEACGQVPLEQVQEALSQQLLAEQQEAYLAQRRAQLVEGADIWRAPEAP